MPRWCRLLLLVLGVVLLAGCQAQLDVRIDVNDDGSGVVTADVTLDPEAASRTILFFDGGTRVDDLRATGWTVTGPTQLPDTTYRMQASKPFSQADQLPAVMDELAGHDGAFRDFKLDRSTSFGKHSWTLTGTVDLTKGTAAFSDADLTALLGAPPLGATKAEQTAALGQPLESIAHVTVQARLPGELGEHNGTVAKPPRGAPPPTTTTATTAPPATGPDGLP